MITPLLNTFNIKKDKVKRTEDTKYIMFCVRVINLLTDDIGHYITTELCIMTRYYITQATDNDILRDSRFLNL